MDWENGLATSRADRAGVAEDWLSARGAAAALGVNPRTIRRAIERGALPATRVAGAFRIHPADLARYRQARTTSCAPGRGPAPVLRMVPPAQPPLPPLPAPLTSFVGRTVLIARVTDLVRRPETRLLTLTGPGGVGKTRLATHVAGELRAEFADGVGYIPLASVREPAQLVPAIARALRPRDGDRAPLEQQVQAALGDRHALLVLDNFEQIVDAGPALVDLLGACPCLTLLVTSRAPLRVMGEQTCPVPPLTLPPPGASAEVINAEAVRLFIERAAAIEPDVARTESTAPAIAAICARLDGLPLAIELAAARANLLAPPAMLARLDQRLTLLTGGPRDQPARLQTMRGAIAWSYDLLSPDDQAIFRRLSVFADGFTFDAAERVVGRATWVVTNDVKATHDPRPTSHDSVLDSLASLVDKSLIRQTPRPDGEPRFAMLETIREYGLEQLAEQGEAATAHAAHAAYFLALAERGERAFVEGGDDNWRDLLAPEVDNFRAAEAWLAGHGQIEAALRLVTALKPLWRIVGDTAGARRALVAYLARADDVAPGVRIKALILAALYEGAGGDCPRGMALADEAVATAREHDDAFGEAEALATLGMLSFFLGRADDGVRYTEDAIGRYRALGDRHELGHALCQLAMGGNLGAFDGPDGPAALAQAAAATEEALALFRELDEPTAIARAYCGLGFFDYKQHEHARAAALLHESIARFWQLHDVWGMAAPIEHLAAVAGLTGRPAPAARLYGVIDALRGTIGRPVPPAFQAVREHERSISRAALGEDVFNAALSEGRNLPLEEAVAEALALATTVAAEREEQARLPTTLTSREIDVLRLLAGGMTNPEIADVLFITVGTTKGYVRNIFAKLDVNSRAAAAVAAHRLGVT